MKDTFYFSHDYNARNDEKIKLLIRKHGILGYGVYWSIIEDLYNNANALRTDYEGIAYDLRVHEDIVKSIINDFNLFQFDDCFFGSLSVERRLDERNIKSRKASESANKRWAKLKIDANALQTECERNAIKERKGKESKGNIKEGDKSENPISAETKEVEIPFVPIIPPPKPPEPPKPPKTQILSEADKFLLCIPKEWQEITKKWLDYKKEKKESYKGQTSLNTFFSQLKTFSKGNVESAKGIINYSIANNYSGVFEPKPTNQTNIQNGENRRFVDKTINHADYKL